MSNNNVNSNNVNSNNVNSNNVNSNNVNSNVRRGGDNNFEGCPALMSDGRFLTSYKPNCEMNRMIERTFNSKTPLSSWEYKYNLTTNAEKVMNMIKEECKNQTVMIITHDVEILPYCNKVVDINKINKK